MPKNHSIIISHYIMFTYRLLKIINKIQFLNSNYKIKEENMYFIKSVIANYEVTYLLIKKSD